MTFDNPTADELKHAACEFGWTGAGGDTDELQRLVRPTLEAYRLLDAYVSDLPQALQRYPRDAGYAPSPAENPHGAWCRRVEVRGAGEGLLSGRQVALKDNIFLAGVPLANGNFLLDGYTPTFDATVVTRLLDAGASIVGKATCENLCFSGNSFTANTGPVHNPHRRGYSAGGSSSGCAAVVAAGDVPMAVGADQGGSVRIPAALCGIHGMKPTYGLVPYTGVLPIEPTIDHLGPMTATVADNALLLEVLAGDDCIDPRQRNVRVQRYTQALGQGLQGLRVGVLAEGFAQPGACAQLNALVRRAAAAMQKLGASVEDVTMPLHLLAPALCRPILVEGSIRTMFRDDAFGTGRHDIYPVDLMDRFRGWSTHTQALSESVRINLIAGSFLMARHGAHFYGKAMNAGRDLRRKYDEILSRVDVMLMPTTPATAPQLPRESSSPAELALAAWGMTPNTFPFNVTGHPAMSVPCGRVDGMPAGMMLVARHHDEVSIYRLAHAYEQAHGPDGTPH